MIGPLRYRATRVQGDFCQNMTPGSRDFSSKLWIFENIYVRTIKKMFLQAKIWKFSQKLDPWLGIFLDDDTRGQGKFMNYTPVARDFLRIMHPCLGEIFEKHTRLGRSSVSPPNGQLTPRGQKLPLVCLIRRLNAQCQIYVGYIHI